MKAFQQAATMGLLAFGISVAHAAPVPVPSLPPAFPAPYSLSLSSFGSSASSPRINVTITNISPYTLGFFLESASFTCFTVEYRGGMAPSSKWVMLKENLQPRPDPTRTSTYSILITITPGQRYETYDALVNFPAPEGFYRITAVRAPKMDELIGSANSLKLVRKFDADVRSNSVIIRRTFNGLLEVPQ